MTFTPRPYQTRATTATLDYHARGVRRVCVVAPPGAGKTTIGTMFALARQGQRGLWLANRIELIDQAADRLRGAGLDVGVISPNHAPDPWAAVQVASLDTLVARGKRPPADWVVKDECFPRGIPVTLSDGASVPIESVVPGQRVFLGGYVRRVMVRSTIERLVRVTHAVGELTCTLNHPVYVKGKGYVEAKGVRNGDLLCVWESVDEHDEQSRPASAEDVFRAVQEAAFFDDHGGNESRLRERAHARTQPDVAPGDSQEDGRDFAGDGASALSTRRQRARAYRPGDGSRAPSESIGGGDRLEPGHSYGYARGHSDALQAGCLTLCDARGDRGGRGEPPGPPGSGPTERRVAQWSRVASVALLEQASDGATGGMCGSRLVYNLETDSGCYVASGVLVHNCHHSPAETYSAVLDSYPNADHLGLTATPCRQDGKALTGHYDALVVAASYSELLALNAAAPMQGIVPCRVAPPPESDGYLGNAIAKDPLAAWLEMPEGPRQTIAFAPTVERAYEWTAAFNAAGVPSACVEGKTSDAERDAHLQRFRSGELRVLWNVYVLTEGTDIPSASCCLLACAVQSVGGFLQRTGRVLRPAPGKRDARLIDLSGAFWLHGAPTADREYSLDGRPIRMTGEPLKNCPQCGIVVPARLPECECGYVWPARERPKLKVYDLALQWEIDSAGGDATAVGVDAKRREWDRLLHLVETREKWSVGFARREYEKLFAEPPPAEWVALASGKVQARELRKLTRVAIAKGYKPGWCGFRFKSQFHRFPSAQQNELARREVHARIVADLFAGLFGTEASNV